MDEYLALPDGAGRFPQDFSGPVVLRVSAGSLVIRLQDYHLLWCSFPEASTSTYEYRYAALQPLTGRNQSGLGFSPFARHY